MIKKLLLTTVAGLAMSSSAFAILPPLYQGVAELKAIITDPSLDQFLQSGEVIESITKTDDGYLIQTNHHQLSVRVVYEPQHMPGPAKFKIVFQSPIPNKE